MKSRCLSGLLARNRDAQISRLRQDIFDVQAPKVEYIEQLEAENADLSKKLRAATIRIEQMETARPHWTKGYSSDSIAAQVAHVALDSLYDMLGVKDQTAASSALNEKINEIARLKQRVCVSWRPSSASPSVSFRMAQASEINQAYRVKEVQYSLARDGELTCSVQASRVVL